MFNAKQLLASVALVAGAVPAMASMTTIDISAYTDTSWNEGQSFGPAMTGNSGTALSNVVFDLLPTYTHNVWLGDVNGESITVPINIQGATSVYTLFNSWWGMPGLATVSVTFNGSAGASQSFTLYGGSDIRDWVQNPYTNSINGTTTQEWWTIATNKRLDAQAFMLDAAFASQNLTNMVVTALNVQRGGSAPVLSAVTVESGETAAVPEPATLAMVLPGIAMVGWISRRRRQGKAA